MNHQYKQDAYSKRAKIEGHPDRAYYKLEEIDKKNDLITRHSIVLDLGSSLGGWTEYAARKAFEGKVLSIDLIELDYTVKYLSNVEHIIKNVFDKDLIKKIHAHKNDKDADYKWRQFNVILSDLAPSTTGNKIIDQSKSLELSERALEIAKELLKPDGNFVCKIFESEYVKQFHNNMKEYFDKVINYHPHTSKKGSQELYLIGKNRK